MLAETYRRASAPEPPRLLLDHAGAMHMATHAADQLAALVAAGRATPPSERWPSWGALKSEDVGMVSALAMFHGLPDTIKVGGVVVVHGLTVMHYESPQAARAALLAEA